MPMRTHGFLAFALATLALAAPARAQLIPGPGGFGPRAPTLSPIVSARGGWSLRESSPSLGAELRMPIPIPLLRPSIAAGGDVVFRTDLVERQAMAEVTSGIVAPLFVGGGPAVLNSVFPDQTTRSTKTGFTLVAGLRSGGRGPRPLSVDLTFRWLRVEDLHPRFFVLSVGYPLLRLFGGG